MFSLPRVNVKILLVDDDANQIVLLHKVLKTIGQVFFEQNGQAALEQVATVRPDVILLDIEMPGLDGYEVLSHLKADALTRDIPVIFITSHDSVDDQLRCLREGAVDFIVKPLQPEVVAARVRTQLALRDRERELLEVNRHARLTLASIGDAAITTDQAYCVTYMNPVAELMAGISLQDAKGRPIEEVMPLRIGDDGPPHVNPVRLAVSERRVVGMAFNCQMLSHTGRWLPVEDSAAPLVSETGDVIGAVIVFRDIDESRAMALKMAHTVQYDQLTNLPNRFLLMERLKVEMEQSQRNGRKLGLLVLDIDRFKLLNEEFGFEYGDALLKKVAKTMQQQLQRNETLSRHNADEFMVLVPGLERLGELGNLAVAIKEQVMGLARRHPELDDFSVSLGVSVYPDDAADAQALLLHADMALNRAKSDASYEGVCFFSEKIESSFTTRRQHYSRIKGAIANNRVIALYQPMVEPASGKLVAVEALMRVRGEDGALVSPDEFIALAEETRLIIPLGERMVHHALAQLRDWTRTGRRIRMCLNISPVQFLDAHFVPFLLKAIEQYEVDPVLVELEVTESLMMQNLEQVTRGMERLRALGVSISIDDFGTGFSCLSYLKDLPIDVLKIDKSFVAQLAPERMDDVLVKTIVALAQSMGLQTVAEGVESARQAQHLRGLGVSLLQGYHFSRPVTAEQLKADYPI